MPIRPTAVAANPDMGVIVHLLGPSRAYPVNYRHVQINEAALSWENGGLNYPAVVSAAADEAGGQAFVTDFAGPVQVGLFVLPPIPEPSLEFIAQSETLGDLVESGGARLISGYPVMLPLLREALHEPEAVEGDGDDWLWDPENAHLTVDIAAFVERVRVEVQAPRDAINALFEDDPYLTRLYTTLSPDGMSLDPEFGFNLDLPDVPNVRVATRTFYCDEDGELASVVVHTPSGAAYYELDRRNPNPILRQMGETVRGADRFAAAVIEVVSGAGQPMVEVDRRETIQEEIDEDAEAVGMPPPLAQPAGEDPGCDCDATRGSPVSALCLLGLLGLARRRRGQSGGQRMKWEGQ